MLKDWNIAKLRPHGYSLSKVINKTGQVVLVKFILQHTHKNSYT